MEIEIMQPVHWPLVKTIYEEGIATGNATFQTTAPAWEEWDAGHIKNCRLVAIQNGQERYRLGCTNAREWPLCVCRRS